MTDCFCQTEGIVPWIFCSPHCMGCMKSCLSKTFYLYRISFAHFPILFNSLKCLFHHLISCAEGVFHFLISLLQHTCNIFISSSFISRLAKVLLPTSRW